MISGLAPYFITPLTPPLGLETLSLFYLASEMATKRLPVCHIDVADGRGNFTQLIVERGDIVELGTPDDGSYRFVKFEDKFSSFSVFSQLGKDHKVLRLLTISEGSTFHSSEGNYYVFHVT